MNLSEDKYVWVPVQMCQFGLKENFHKPMRLYLFFAMGVSGLTSFNKSIKDKSSSKLDCSARTVERYMKKLLDRNWVGKNPKTGTHFIRSFEAIRRQEDLKNTTAVKLSLQELRSTKRFQGFCTASIIGNRIRKKQREEEHLNKKDDVHSRMLNLPLNSMTVAANYLKPILGLSKATCHRLKQYAKEYAYININKNIERVQFDDSMILHSNQYDLPLPGYYRKTKTNKIYEYVKPDIITSNLKYKYRKRISRQN